MRRYWINAPGSGVNDSLWSHEFNKHATCMSTVRPECFSSKKAAGKRKDVADYFHKVVQLYKDLDSYEILKDGGIIPSATKNYTLSAIQQVFIDRIGVDVTPWCDAENRLSEMWYSFNIKGGGVLDGQYVHISPVGTKSNCQERDIQYLPKPRASNNTHF